MTVSEAFKGRVATLRDRRTLAFRVLAEGKPPVPVAGAKAVRHAVERAKVCRQTHPNWIPIPDHPYRQATYIYAEGRSLPNWEGDISALIPQILGKPLTQFMIGG